MDIRDNIIQQALRVAYDQTHDRTSKQVAHKHTIKKFNQIKFKRDEKATLSLSLKGYDLYIFLPLWQQVTKKFKYA